MARLEMLTTFLASYHDDSIILTFDEIESLSGARLPRTARKAWSSYWANTERNVYARHWLSEGFEATFDGCGPDEVQFVRQGTAEVERGRPAAGEIFVDIVRDPIAAAEAPPPSDLPPPPSSPEHVQRNRAAQVAAELAGWFHTAGGDLPGRAGRDRPGWGHLADVEAAQALVATGHDVIWVRLLVTFGALVDRGRHHRPTWDRLGALLADDAGAFDPTGVVGRSVGELGDQLTRAGVTARPSDVIAWRLLGEVLAEPDVVPWLYSAVFEGAADVAGVVDELEDRPTTAVRTVADRLIGRRGAGRWLRMLAHPGQVALDGLDHLPVTVDAPVRRATAYLGVLDTAGRPDAEVVPEIQAVWARAVADRPPEGPAGLAGTALALDEALWFHGQVGCRFCRRSLLREPIAPACSGCRLGA